MNQFITRHLVQMLAVTIIASWSLASVTTTRGQAPEVVTPSETLSEQKLDQFAAAMENMAGLVEQYDQQLATATPSDRQRIVGEANRALEKAVTDNGLTVEEYLSIVRLAENESGLRQKIINRIHPPK
jgi:hypothetical protein